MPTIQHARPRRSRRLVRRALAALALAAGAACGDDGGPAGPSPVLAGRWAGTGYGGLLRFGATFTQAGDSVGGAGSFSSPLGGDDFVVTGRLRGANVSLVLTSDELGATTYTGRFSGADRVEGTLVVPGREDIQLTIDRD